MQGHLGPQTHKHDSIVLGFDCGTSRLKMGGCGFRNTNIPVTCLRLSMLANAPRMSLRAGLFEPLTTSADC